MQSILASMQAEAKSKLPAGATLACTSMASVLAAPGAAAMLLYASAHFFLVDSL